MLDGSAEGKVKSAAERASLVAIIAALAGEWVAARGGARCLPPGSLLI